MLQIVTELDGFDPRGNIKVLMATNRPDTLDPALLRPGRLDRKVEFGLPDLEGRTHILKIHAKTMAVDRDIRYELLARLCPNTTGAELRSVCTEAGMFAIRSRRSVAHIAIPVTKCRASDLPAADPATSRAQEIHQREGFPRGGQQGDQGLPKVQQHTQGAWNWNAQRHYPQRSDCALLGSRSTWCTTDQRAHRRSFATAPTKRGDRSGSVAKRPRHSSRPGFVFDRPGNPPERWQRLVGFFYELIAPHDHRRKPGSPLRASSTTRAHRGAAPHGPRTRAARPAARQERVALTRGGAELLIHAYCHLARVLKLTLRVFEQVFLHPEDSCHLTCGAVARARAPDPTPHETMSFSHPCEGSLAAGSVPLQVVQRNPLVLPLAQIDGHSVGHARFLLAIVDGRGPIRKRTQRREKQRHVWRRGGLQHR